MTALDDKDKLKLTKISHELNQQLRFKVLKFKIVEIHHVHILTTTKKVIYKKPKDNNITTIY